MASRWQHKLSDLQWLGSGKDYLTWSDFLQALMQAQFSQAMVYNSGSSMYLTCRGLDQAMSAVGWAWREPRVAYFSMDCGCRMPF